MCAPLASLRRWDGRKQLQKCLAPTVIFGSFAVTMSDSPKDVQEAHRKAQGDQPLQPLETLSRKRRGSANMAVAAGAGSWASHLRTGGRRGWVSAWACTT
jgi:hypothetical protein